MTYRNAIHNDLCFIFDFEDFCFDFLGRLRSLSHFLEKKEKENEK